MKTRVLCVLLLLTMLPLGALADKTLYEIPEENVGVPYFGIENYTFVTPDNYTEYMDLLCSYGFTQSQVRDRYSRGTILYEAFREDVPEGYYRLEVFEDDFSHSIWTNYDGSGKKFLNAVETIPDRGWIEEYYHLYQIDVYNSEETRYARGWLYTSPDDPYEAGFFRLSFYNGRAFLYSFLCREPVKSIDTISLVFGDGRGHEIYDYLLGSRACYDYGLTVLDKSLTRDPMADLLPDLPAVFNLHTGNFTVRGTAQKGAQVKAAAGESVKNANVDEEDATFRVNVNISPENSAVTLTATKKGLQDNEITFTLPVDDSIAMLSLTDYPFGDVDRTKMKVRGTTDPGGRITYRVDDGEEQKAEVQESGAFTFTYTGADFEDHVLSITASQAGCEDYTVELPFSPYYEDAEAGIRAYKKLLDGDAVNHEIDTKAFIKDFSAAFAEDPMAYVGKKYYLPIVIDYVSCENGYTNCYATVMSNYALSDINLILVGDGYWENRLTRFGRWGGKVQWIKVYGEFLEPTLTDPVLPRFKIEFVVYGG